MQNKKKLIYCLENVLQTGVEVVGITFDGARQNFSMCTLLDSDISIIQDEYVFKIDNSDTKFVIFPDPVHMLKLIRNCLGDNLILFDSVNKTN